jgi:hypothetical protein
MSTAPKPIRDRVAEQIELEAVGDLPPKDLERAVDAVMFTIAGDESYTDKDTLDLVDLVMAGWDLKAAADRAAHAGRVDVADERRVARHLVKALVELYTGRPVTTGLPPNPYHVGKASRDVVFDHHGLHQLDPAHAYLLGVWLIAVSDPTLENAPRDLLLVATR